MPSAILWQAAPVSRGEALGTHINSLGNAAYSTVGVAFDNTTNLDQWAAAEIVIASVTVVSGSYVELFLVQSLDGTNYEDAPSSSNPGTHMFRARCNLTAATAARRVMTDWFRVPPGKWKFVLYQTIGVALPASGNTVTIYTSNDEVQN